MQERLGMFFKAHHLPVLHNIKTQIKSASHWPTILTWFIVTAVWTLEATASTRALILK